MQGCASSDNLVQGETNVCKLPREHPQDSLGLGAGSSHGIAQRLTATSWLFQSQRKAIATCGPASGASPFAAPGCMQHLEVAAEAETRQA